MKRWLWLVLLTLFVADGLLLVNDFVYWDGILAASRWLSGDRELFRAGFVVSGVAPGYYAHAALGALPGFPVAHKVGAFASVGLTACAFAWLARRTGKLSGGEAAFAGAIFLVAPALDTFVDIVMTHYAVCVACFAIGAVLIVRAKDLDGPAPAKIALRAVGAVLLAYSFTIRSLLVMHFAFLAYLFLLADDLRPLPTLARRLAAFALRHGDLLLLPFAFWGLSEILTPRVGEYVAYNAIKPSPRAFLGGARLFAVSTLYHGPKNILLVLVRHPVALLAPLGFAALTFFAARKESEVLPPAPGPEPVGIVDRHPIAGVAVIGLALAFVGAFPYMAIGTGPTMIGWATRHGLMVPFGAGLVLVAVARLLARATGRPLVAPVFWGLLLGAAAARSFDAQIDWLARGAKDRGIVAHLRALPEPPPGTFHVVDRFPLGGEPNYRFYEWATWGGEAWGTHTHAAFEEASFNADLATNRQFFTTAYNAEKVPADGGCSARVTLAPNPELARPWALGARYLQDRFGGTATPERQRAYVAFELIRDPARDGASCPLAPAAPSP